MTQNTNRWFAFVVMPFDPEFDDIFRDLIKAPLIEVGYEVKRADNIASQQNILRDIIESTFAADLVIADLTLLNPNVMYELGIAHAINAPTAMITQDIHQLPFDLKPYRVHEYSLNYQDAEKLKAHLREVGRGRQLGTMAFGNPVTDFAPQGALSNILRARVTQPQIGLGPQDDQRDEERGFLDYAIEVEDSQRLVAEQVQRLGAVLDGFNSDTQTLMSDFTSMSSNVSQMSPRRKRELFNAFAQILVLHHGDFDTGLFLR